jgi:hypothetical protein
VPPNQRLQLTLAVYRRPAFGRAARRVYHEWRDRTDVLCWYDPRAPAGRS